MQWTGLLVPVMYGYSYGTGTPYSYLYVQNGLLSCSGPTWSLGYTYSSTYSAPRSIY